MAEKRQTRLSHKGREYMKTVKLKEIGRSYRKLNKCMDEIDLLMVTKEDIHGKYESWLLLYEQFSDANEQYRELLSPSEKEEHDINIETTCMVAIQSFRTNAEKYMLGSGSRIEHRQNYMDNVTPHDSASNIDFGQKRGDSVTHSKASMLSLRSSVLHDRQKAAEEKVRKQTKLEMQAIELEKLKLEIKEEELKLKSEISVIHARQSVLDSFLKTRSKVGSCDTEMHSVHGSRQSLGKPSQAPPGIDNDSQVSGSSAHISQFVSAPCAYLNDGFDNKQRALPRAEPVVRAPTQPPIASTAYVSGLKTGSHLLGVPVPVSMPLLPFPMFSETDAPSQPRAQLPASYAPNPVPQAPSAPSSVSLAPPTRQAVLMAPSVPQSAPLTPSVPQPVPLMSYVPRPVTSVVPPESFATAWPQTVPIEPTVPTYGKPMPPPMPVPRAPHVPSACPEYPAHFGAYPMPSNLSPLATPYVPPVAPPVSYRSLENEAVTHVARLLRKPPTEIKKFEGDPMDYKRFLRQFNSSVVMNTETDEERMNYLEQFTTGEANRVVCGFGYLDNGYAAALEELALRYGNPSVIVSAFIRKALDWPIIRPDDPRGLNEFSIFLGECLHAVKSVNTGGTLDSLEDMKRLLGKLPFHLHDRWRSRVLGDSVMLRQPGFEQFVSFVRSEARKANDPAFGREAIAKYVPERNSRRQNKPQVKSSCAVTATEQKEVQASMSKPTKGPAHKAGSTDKAKVKVKSDVSGSCTAPEVEKCAYCSGKDHPLNDCHRYGQLSIDAKLTFLRERGMCFGCLGQGHMRIDCPKKHRCDTCKRRHPTVLHNEDYMKPRPDGVDKVVSSASLGRNEESDTESDGECTMAIVPVRIRKRNSAKEIVTYAFLDPGSNASFMTHDLMRELGCEGKRVNITVSTMSTPWSVQTHILKDIEIVGLEESSVIEIPHLYSKKELPVTDRHIPVQSDIDKWPHLEGIKLQNINAPISLMIGNNIPDVYTPMEMRTGPAGSPHATRTRIGWIPWNVIRQGRNKDSELSANFTNVVAKQLESLEKLVRDSIDRDFPERAIDDKRCLSREDMKFMEKMESGKFEAGHHVLPLPFRDDEISLPDNQKQACSRLNSLRRRLASDETKMTEYKEFMNKMFEKGYAEEVPVKDLERNDGRVWYIPHHGVNHPKTGKFRVVFDCSAKFAGVSLNDSLLQGPNLTNSLLAVLLCFRQESVALSADIEAMFYQVHVPVKDRDCMRFLWWKDGDLSKQPTLYRMTVHVFGAVSSPACSNVALRSCGVGHEEDFRSEVLDCLKKNFYVDDFLKSVCRDAYAIELTNDIVQLCASGGFHLHKWVSNRRPVLEEIPRAEQAKNVSALDLDTEDLPTERALRVIWAVDHDTFGFRIKEMSDPAKYDGASVNSRKKKFEFIFSTVFLPKQQKKYI